MTASRRIALVATIATLLQIASGGVVRATGSGDACPDWPRCFGRWVPPLRSDTLIEWSHRLLAQIVIWTIVALAVVAFRRRREARGFWYASLGAVAGVLVQAFLGAVVVWSKGEGATLASMGPAFVTVHIATAMALVGLLTAMAVQASCEERTARGDVKGSVPDRVRALGIAAAAGVFGLILAGAWVRGAGAGPAFGDWPLMDGSLLPSLSGPAIPHAVHRLVALLAGALVVAYAVAAVRARPREVAVTTFALLAASLFVAQVLVGAAQVWTGLAAAPVSAHVALAAAIWASLVAGVTVASRLAACAVPAARLERPVRREPAPVSGAQVVEAPAPALPRAGGTAVVRAYVRLTKPRIIVLLLVTTVPAMVLAARGLPSLGLIAATLLGGTLAAAGANTINCYVDRDIDAVMARTRRRPLPAHEIEPARALAFGISLGLASFALLWSAVNLLAALLSTAAILFYVFVYTIALKRSTPQNIVIGGAAGAVPTLVGWAAVTGTVGAPALVLFGIVFLWTPPHFWALAMRYATDYARAGVPMLPVVSGDEATKRQILWYAVATVGASLVLHPVARMGGLYLGAAIVLGAWFLRRALALRRDAGSAKPALALFRASILYLAALFAAVGFDAALLSAR